MNIKIFTDGGSKGNPGPAAIGIVAYRGSEELFRYREDIGTATNNDAEYRALMKAFELIKEYKASHANEAINHVDFYSDSRLMVNQVKGLFKVNEARLREYVMHIRILEAELGCSTNYHDIPPEQNKVADALVNNK